MTADSQRASTKIGPDRRQVVASLIGAAPAFALLSRQAYSQEVRSFKLAVGQRGNWDSSLCELAQNAGVFRRHGLVLDITYTQGGGETIQAVAPRSVDFGVAAGTVGVLGALSRGAPLRIIGGEMTGVDEMYWYVPIDSPVQTIADLAGRTVGYSTNGSSTHQAALNIQARENPDMQLVATGSLAGTYTQVMSGQIDAGWSSAPFGLEALGKDIREIARGNQVAAMRDQTVRSLICHAAGLEERREDYVRFIAAYRDAIDWLYSGDEPLAAYAEFTGLPREVAMRTRDEYFQKASLDPARFNGLETMMRDAVTFRFLPAPLPEEQLREAVQILAAS